MSNRTMYDKVKNGIGRLFNEGFDEEAYAVKAMLEKMQEDKPKSPPPKPEELSGTPSPSFTDTVTILESKAFDIVLTRSNNHALEARYFLRYGLQASIHVFLTEGVSEFNACMAHAMESAGYLPYRGE